MTWQPRLRRGDRPWYVAIVDALEEDIASGALAPNTRLPTHRELSEKLRLSIGTVTRAYLEAEKRGLIRSEGRRGTYVGESRERRAPFSNPFEPDSGLIDMSRFQPAASEDPDLSAALRRLSRRSKTQWLLQYTPASGLPHHREAGARWIQKLGMDADADSVVITEGAQHAITVILSAVAKRGDVVLSDAHTYPGLRPITELLGLRLTGVPADEEGLLPDELEAACAKKKARVLYCNPTIHNPTATIVPARRRKEIAAVAERHGVLIVEDEANRCFVTDPPPLITALAPEQSFLVATMSKIVAAGLRACFVRAPARFVCPLRDVVFTTVHMPNPISLEVLAHWVDDGTAEATVARRRSKTEERQGIADRILGAYKPQTPPTSGFIWMPLPKGWSAAHFTEAARSRGVVVLPADVFAVDRSCAANSVRVCVGATTSREQLTTGLTTLVDILNSPAKSGQITI